ncbi:hypothetical protein NP493_662g01030 [Ridgeia piscesae]|uniref:Uncharacterized protein n=1 Tax=Ridgeia piscesae TaxID=27915 RepID=A0AAD9KSB5_RIDPI|nr:hypothetical protein NP493_662g01030 [Ridgeia piscesae]
MRVKLCMCQEEEPWKSQHSTQTWMCRRW